MSRFKYLLGFLLMIPLSASAWQWQDLWQTADQRASQLLQAGKAADAAKLFRNDNWRAVAQYRSGNYEQAYKAFSVNQSSDGQYNAGNAAAFMEHYQEALAAYDKAIALNPHNEDAITNREIIKKLLKQQQQNKSADNKNKSGDNKNSAEKNNPSDKQNDPAKDQNKSTASQDKTDKQNQPQQNQQQNQQTQQQRHNLTKQQRQNENNKQLLRSLADDPGSLLQQKFLRDYAHRHGIEDNFDQGIN